ncbi:MAG: hypothetical protein WBC90_07295 [Albidovulum sp.]
MTEKDSADVMAIFSAAEKIAIAQNEDFSSLVRFTDSNGEYFAVGDYAEFRDKSGKLYKISDETWSALVRRADKLVEPFDCTGGKW